MHAATQTTQEKRVVSAGGSRLASPTTPASAVSCQPAPVQGEPPAGLDQLSLHKQLKSTEVIHSNSECAPDTQPASVQGRFSVGSNADGLVSSKLLAGADAVVLPSMTAQPGTNARQSGRGATATADARQLSLCEPQPGSSEQTESPATSTAVQLHIAAAQSQHAKPPPGSATSGAAKNAESQPIACTLLGTSSNTITADCSVPLATTPQAFCLPGPLSGSLLPPLMPALLTAPAATNCSGQISAATSTTPIATSIGDTLVPASGCSKQQVQQQQQRQQPSGMPVQKSGSPEQALYPVVDTGKGRAVRSVVSAVDDMSELEMDVDTTTSMPVCTAVTNDPAVTASRSRLSAFKRPSSEDVLALVLSPDAPVKKQKITGVHAADHPGAEFSSTSLTTAEHAMPYATDLAQLPAAAAAAAVAASLSATVSDAMSAAACTHVLQVSRSALQASLLPDTACVSGGLHSSIAKLSLPTASNSIAAHTLPLPISLSSERGLHASFKPPAQTQHLKQTPVTLFSSSVVTLKQGSISSKAAKSGPGDIGMPSQCTGPVFAAYKPVIEELSSDSNQRISLGSKEPGPAKLAQQPAHVAGNDSDDRAAPRQYAVAAKPERDVQQPTEDQAHQMQSSYQPAVQLVFDHDTSSENGRHSGNDRHTQLAQQQQRPTADTPAGFTQHAVASDLGAIFSSFTAFEDMSDGEEEDDEPSAGMLSPMQANSVESQPSCEAYLCRAEFV